MIKMADKKEEPEKEPEYEYHCINTKKLEKTKDDNTENIIYQ